MRLISKEKLEYFKSLEAQRDRLWKENEELKEIIDNTVTDHEFLSGLTELLNDRKAGIAKVHRHDNGVITFEAARAYEKMKGIAND